ncbi:hypothetical protein AB0J74_05930 [Asanoa sp. NPDC049573]|uniref:WD40 repeat domain-containing protein n=1 Tax=Asanoa sp. NPDC049573 TaxID=3155396 RepID=UPI003438F4D5
MSTELRRALRELTDVPPPADLAAKSIRLAGRRRRNRVVAAAVVVAVVAVGVPLLLRPDRVDEPSPISPSVSPTTATPPAVPATPQVVVFAYAGVLPKRPTGNEPITPADSTSYLLDRATGEYRAFPYVTALPSPDGRRFFVADGERGGVKDGAGGAVRRVDAYDSHTNAVDWSPDGRRLLISSVGKEEPGGFTVVDAETLTAGPFVPMTDMHQLNARGLGFFWARDGRSIGHTITAAGGEGYLDRDKTLAIRFYDLKGKTLRTIGLTGTAAVRSTAAVSPDGSRAAAVLDVDKLVRIVDLTTGEVTAEFQAGGVAGWYDADHLVARDDDALVVVDLSGRVVRSIPAPSELLAGSEVHLVRARGLPAASAGHAF